MCAGGVSGPWTLSSLSWERGQVFSGKGRKSWREEAPRSKGRQDRRQEGEPEGHLPEMPRHAVCLQQCQH